jgi:hypothetical protein
MELSFSMMSKQGLVSSYYKDFPLKGNSPRMNDALPNGQGIVKNLCVPQFLIALAAVRGGADFQPLIHVSNGNDRTDENVM